ncbi:MAG: nuclear transport factor 2 family protein [Flavobacteriales bacterium]|nr:nuclear transport factor 2 family protein [Flavobacteriales bacterium]
MINTATFWSMEESKAFAEKWLPAWTGNDADGLISFYAEDAFYLDPARPKGIHGKNEIYKYFQRLLNHYPNWVWTQREAIPMQHGFVNLWNLRDSNVNIDGLCFVQMDSNHKILRNEVYFDRTLLIKQ